MVAVDRRRRGVDEPADAGVAGGDEHVHDAVHVHGVRRERVGHGPGDGPEGGLVEHDVDPDARPAARVEVADVALGHGEGLFTRPRCRVDVTPRPGRKVIEHRHPLAPREQGLDEVRADKPGPAGHEPRPGAGPEPLQGALVRGGRGGERVGHAYGTSRVQGSAGVPPSPTKRRAGCQRYARRARRRRLLDPKAGPGRAARGRRLPAFRPAGGPLAPAAAPSERRSPGLSRSKAAKFSLPPKLTGVIPADAGIRAAVSQRRGRYGFPSARE